MEGIQEPIIQPIPINLYPGAFAQPQNNPLAVYILPTPATKSKPAAPAPKAHASPSLLVQNFKILVANVQTFATTSKTMAAAQTAWHIVDGSGAGSGLEHLDLSIPTRSTNFNSLQRPKKTGLGGAQSPPLFVLIFPVLFYFIVLYLDFYNFSF